MRPPFLRSPERLDGRTEYDRESSFDAHSHSDTPPVYERPLFRRTIRLTDLTILRRAWVFSL